MNIKTACVTFAAVLAFAGIAGAWGLPSIPSLGSGTSSSADPDAFLVKAQRSETLIDKSADSLFKAVASKEEQAKMEELQKKLNETTDDKEKNALRHQITESEMATIEKQAKNKDIQKQAKDYDDKKKTQISNAFYNFSLGALQAALLVPEGQNIAKSIAGNPINAARLAFKLNSIYDSVKSIGGILGNTTKVISAMKPLMSAANIQTKMAVTETDQPVVVVGGL
jgi:septal ring factor EnvC (AmiA/AmiB activator)